MFNLPIAILHVGVLMILDIKVTPHDCIGIGLYTPTSLLDINNCTPLILHDPRTHNKARALISLWEVIRHSGFCPGFLEWW